MTDTQKPARSVNSKLILVAEDDIFYANIYKMKLQKEGFEVLIVGNGSWVLKTLESQIPKLILLDLVMPVMDGFVTLEQIKKNKAFEKITVIVLSNLGQDEDVKRALSMGANDYLVKTNISIQDVMAKVNKYMQ